MLFLRRNENCDCFNTPVSEYFTTFMELTTNSTLPDAIVEHFEEQEMEQLHKELEQPETHTETSSTKL